MSNNDEVINVTQKLLQTGYLFKNEDRSILPLRINRSIGPNKAVDLLPTFKKIYGLTLEGRNERAAELLSEVAGLLVAADLGIAEDFLIEMEVKKMMPKLLKTVQRDLVRSVLNDQPKGKD
jgi:hypothetical protein